VPKLLGDREEDVRGSSIVAMTTIGADAKEAIPALTALLDEDEEIAALAANALVAIDPTQESKLPERLTRLLPRVREELRRITDPTHGDEVRVE